MRLAPVAIRYWRDRAALRDLAARQSKTTHGAPEAVDACVAYAEVLADAIEGRPRSEVLRNRSEPYAGTIAPIMAGSWRGKQRKDIRASGYVAHSLEASLWSVGRTGSFEDAVLLAANLGEDADTTAAITGQLVGALYGAAGIPQRWLDKLAWGTRIRAMADGTFRWRNACPLAETCGGQRRYTIAGIAGVLPSISRRDSSPTHSVVRADAKMNHQHQGPSKTIKTY